MNFLLDTQAVLWWMDDAPRLSGAARAAVADPANVVHVSAVTVWEIVIKVGLGKLEVPTGWDEALAAEPFLRLPVTWEHAIRVGRLPDIHRDPFDRLLIAQAQEEGMTLVTADRVMGRYGVATLDAGA